MKIFNFHGVLGFWSSADMTLVSPGFGVLVRASPDLVAWRFRL